MEFEIPPVEQDFRLEVHDVETGETHTGDVEYWDDDDGAEYFRDFYGG